MNLHQIVKFCFSRILYKINLKATDNLRNYTKEFNPTLAVRFYLLKILEFAENAFKM